MVSGVKEIIIFFWQSFLARSCRAGWFPIVCVVKAIYCTGTGVALVRRVQYLLLGTTATRVHPVAYVRALSCVVIVAV